MRRLRRIKILATLGPASSDSATIRKLFEAGADIFRINMSHTPHEKLREFVATIRNIESNYGRPIGVLVDLQGPKLRIGSFAEGAILLDDGKVRLIVEEASSDRAVTRVAVGGRMSDRKGVSLPDTDLPVSAMTSKDRADLEAALEAGADWIALSFVQRPDDVIETKKLVRGRAAVMAKIEKPQAIERLAEIIDVADGLMVAQIGRAHG